VGLIALAIAAPLLRGDPTRADLVWGGVSGSAGGLGIALLYRALATGRMSVVAPVTAVCAIIIPVAVGALLGERLSPMVLAGVALAMGAIVLIGQEEDRRAEHGAAAQGGARRAAIDRSLAYALAAGVAIGAFYVCLGRTGADAGLWPLLAARVVSVSGFVVVAVVGRRSLRLGAGSRGIVLVAGLLDVTANALYLLAVRQGMMSVVATLSSLYPASTVLLAHLVLGERLRRVQAVGLGAAAVAVVMIAA